VNAPAADTRRALAAVAIALASAPVFTLTYVPSFFERCGYRQIDKAELPHKIWNECVRCPLFPNCHETALIRTAEPAVEAVRDAFAAAASSR